MVFFKRFAYRAAALGGPDCLPPGGTILQDPSMASCRNAPVMYGLVEPATEDIAKLLLLQVYTQASLSLSASGLAVAAAFCSLLVPNLANIWGTFAQGSTGSLSAPLLYCIS